MNALSILTRTSLSQYFRFTSLSTHTHDGINQFSENLLVEINHFHSPQIFSAFADQMPPSIQRAVYKRQLEYLLGRWCAALLLIELGCGEDKSWITSVGRRPVWPKGFIGSISHSRDAVAVIVQRQSPNSESVGVDVESIRLGNESQAALMRCFSDREAGLLSSLEFGFPLGFSVKESLFKCLNPIVNLFFDFLDAEIISICTFSQTVRIYLKRSLANIPNGSVFTAYYEKVLWEDSQIWTAISYPGNLKNLTAVE